MRRFLILFIAAFFLLLSQSHAAPPYPLSAVVVGETITVTMTGLPADQNEYQLYDGSLVVGPNDLATTNNSLKKAVNGSVVWTIKGVAFKTNTTYYFSVKKFPPEAVGALVPPTIVTGVTVLKVGTPAASFVKNFNVIPSSGQEAVVSGTIDTTAYAVNNLEVQFFWSTTEFTDGNNPSDSKEETTGEGGQADIADTGTYQLKLSSLSPKTKYYFKQIIVALGSPTPIDTQMGTFDTTDGFVPAGSVKEQELFDSRSYHLLAPWPGLSVLMDPDLCLEMKSGPNPKLPKDAICDVNGFLNFAFKLLIGLTAVVLVLRLMFEGYQYMVTDVPFLKASAKSGFFTALMGLLLALSAYLILNTINPKLVNNTISIKSVEVGVEEYEREDLPDNIVDSSGKSSACKGGLVGIDTVTQKGILVCADIADKYKNMIAAAKNAGFTLTAGGGRSMATQISLRKQNCGPSDFDIYKKLSRQCSPQTARPGKSMHQFGLAFDIKCNGNLIYWDNNPRNKKYRNVPQTKVCFDWLKTNAFLKNLASENWHWSVNGN